MKMDTLWRCLRRKDAGAAPDMAVHALVLDGGVLANYPGPALCLDSLGRVSAANRDGTQAARLIGDAQAPQLVAAAMRAMAEGTAQSAQLEIPAAKIMLEFVVLPAGSAPPVPEPRGGAQEEAREEAQEEARGAALLLGRDATLEGNLRAVLVESRQRFRDLVEISSDFAWETGADGTFVFVSPRGALGYRADQLVGRDSRALVLECAGDGDMPFLTRHPIEDVEFLFRRADGGVASLLASCVSIRDSGGAWRGARGVCRDITEERARDAALARARTREQLLVRIVRQIRDEITPENMMATAAQATARAIGVSTCRIFRSAGASGFEAVAQFGEIDAVPEAPLGALRGGREVCTAEAEGWRILAMATRYRGAVNGAIMLWRGQAYRPWDEDDLGLLADVASQLGIALEQLANHEELARLSRTDALTGLLNRRVFLEEMRRHMAQARRRGGRGALCYVDLDNFKAVNDSHGHGYGDEVLKAMAEILTGTTRLGDLAARLGGDEFALWLDDTDAAGAAAKAEALLASAGGLARFSGDAGPPLGFSMGIAAFDPGRPERLEDLMARADAAMYQAKRAGKGRLIVAAPAPEAAPEAAPEVVPVAAPEAAR